MSSIISSPSFAPARPLLLLTALWALQPGCTPPAVDGDESGALTPRELWSNADDPSILDPSFTYTFDELPTYGTADRLPWPGSYWPTFRDSINHRWAGPNTRSPAEKYERAFGKSGVEDAVSAYFGVDSLNGAACKKQSDCPAKSRCARRRGDKQGRCSETWFGLCHAWAPAALLEREPQRAVDYGGVRFEVNDIKALVTIAYSEGLSAKLMSLRCDAKASEHDLSDVPACEDTNPGSFHVAVTNLLGLRGQSFIEDRSFDYEVWNFPVIAYKVTRDQQVSPATANKMLGAQGNTYAFNKYAAELRRMRIELTWLGASDSEYDGPLTHAINWFAYTDVYNYILELDADGEIIGGEWVGSSRTNHPDFLWIPVKKYNTAAAGVIEYSDVKKLLDLAT